MITNEWITGNRDISVPLAIRREVFIDEQNVPEDMEYDEFDKQAMHLVIRDGERPVACGRVYFDGNTFRIGRCAVRREARGQGIGDLLVKLLLLKAFEFTESAVRTDAQTAAQGFYERYGFVPTGETFMDVGIEHVPMQVTKETMLLPSKCGHCGSTPEDLIAPDSAQQK